MKIIKFLVALVILSPLSLSAQQGFMVQGKISPMANTQKVYLNYYNEGKEVKDSATVKKGEFSFKGQVSNPVAAILTLKKQDASLSKHEASEELYFYLENSKISITSSNSFRSAVVSGSLTNAENLELQAIHAPFRKIADSVMRVYNGWTLEQRKDSTLTKALAAPMRATQKGYDSVSRIFIANHPNSFIALRLFKEIELGYNFNPDTAERRFSNFSDLVRNSYAGTEMSKIINKGKKTDVGAMAIEFVQRDTSGKEVKLSDFRGQYVLLDFWASWCKPCRAENPNLLKAYNKFKEKRFTILGVSLDDADGRRAWLHAVVQDSMPWTQVSDLKGFKSKVAVDYGVEAIPTNYLISPDGKIIAKNLRGAELEKKLADILGN